MPGVTKKNQRRLSAECQHGIDEPFADNGSAVARRRRRLALIAAAALLCGGAWWLLSPGEDATSTLTTPQAAPQAANPKVESPSLQRLADSKNPEAAIETLQDHKAAERCVQTLAESQRILENINDLRAVFFKQERVDGVLGEINRMDLKVRRKPLSTYMKWHTAPLGREVLWQEGANEGLMLVQAGGWQKLILPVVKLDPLGELALSNSRHPINEIGIWNMTAKLLKQTKAGLSNPHLLANVSEVVVADGRPCHRFSVVHPERYPDQGCRELVIFIDKALKVPLGFEAYDWAAAPDAKPLLLESYLYSKLELNPGLADLDFDSKNPAYEFISK